jgi:hypothetical protein
MWNGGFWRFRVASFFSVQYTKTGDSYRYKNTTKLPNGHKIYQMAENSPNSDKIYQHFPFQGPPKYTHIGIFGLKNIPPGNPGGFRRFCPIFKKVNKIDRLLWQSAVLLRL